MMGVIEVLMFSLQVLMCLGDIVVIEWLVFYVVLQVVQCLYLKVVEILVDLCMGFDFDVFVEVFDMYLVCVCWFMMLFYNLIGVMLIDECKCVLIELFVLCGVLLIEDDVYGELQFGMVFMCFVKLYDDSGFVLYCGLFLKCFVFGFWIGWVVVGCFVQQICQVKGVSGLVVDVFVQMVILSYLCDGVYDWFLCKL